MVCLQLLVARTYTVPLTPSSLLLILSSLGQSHVHMHPQDAFIVLASSDTYIQTLNKFTCLVYFHRFVSKQEIEDYNQTIYTCIFISKKLQNNPLLIYTCVSSLVHRVPLCFASLGFSYGLGCQVSNQAAPQHQMINVQPIHLHADWEGTNHPSQHSWVYQAMHLYQQYTYISNALISTMHLYQQYTYINNALISTTKLHLFSLSTQAI